LREAPFTDRPSPNPLLRIPVVAVVYEQRWGILAWAAGSTLGAVYLVSITRPTVDDLIKGSGAFAAYLTVAGRGDPYTALAGYFWFGIFLSVLAIYAITQVARWSADDGEGRLEMVLSAPVSRTRVVIERAGALLVDTALIIVLSSSGFYVAARADNIPISVSDVVAASVPLIPFALSFAAVGALLASRIPRATVAVLTTLAFISYLITQVGPILKLPEWVMKLSVFSLYGTPITSGIDWTGFTIMVGVTLVGFAAGAALMQRREVGA
jgi:ABC-2 type transport system permease protein